MSDWYHQMMFEDGSTEDLKTLNVYPSRVYAMASAENFCIGSQAAFKRGETPKRVAKIRALRFGDDWCYAETDGYNTTFHPDGPDPKKQ